MKNYASEDKKTLTFFWEIITSDINLYKKQYVLNLRYSQSVQFIPAISTQARIEENVAAKEMIQILAVDIHFQRLQFFIMMLPQAQSMKVG